MYLVKFRNFRQRITLVYHVRSLEPSRYAYQAVPVAHSVDITKKWEYTNIPVLWGQEWFDQNGAELVL